MAKALQGLTEQDGLCFAFAAKRMGRVTSYFYSRVMQLATSAWLSVAILGSCCALSLKFLGQEGQTMQEVVIGAGNAMSAWGLDLAIGHSMQSGEEEVEGGGRKGDEAERSNRRTTKKQQKEEGEQMYL